MGNIVNAINAASGMSPAMPGDENARRLQPGLEPKVTARYTPSQGGSDTSDPKALMQQLRQDVAEQWMREDEEISQQEVQSGCVVDSDRRIDTLERRLASIRAVHEAQIKALDEEVQRISARNPLEPSDEANINTLKERRRMLTTQNAEDVAYVIAAASRNYPQPRAQAVPPTPQPRASPYAQGQSAASVPQNNMGVPSRVGSSSHGSRPYGQLQRQAPPLITHKPAQPQLPVQQRQQQTASSPYLAPHISQPSPPSQHSSVVYSLPQSESLQVDDPPPPAPGFSPGPPPELLPEMQVAQPQAPAPMLQHFTSPFALGEVIGVNAFPSPSSSSPMTMPKQ